VQTVIDMVAQNLPPEGNISLEVRFGVVDLPRAAAVDLWIYAADRQRR